VPFLYSGTVQAFHSQLTPEQLDQKPLKLSITFHPEKPGEDVPFVEIRAAQGSVFGPQPFLAIKTRANRYIHDNLDFAVDSGIWYYAFHGDTLPLEDVLEIGVAANDMLGHTSVVKYRFTY